MSNVDYYVFHAIQNVHFIYNACFVITLISLGSQSERYNEVAVYIIYIYTAVKSPSAKAKYKMAEAEGLAEE